MRICSIEGCGGKHKAKGLCKKHYDQTPERVVKKAIENAARYAANKEEIRAKYFTPEVQAKLAALRATPEGKAKKAAIDAAYKGKRAARAAARKKIDPMFTFRGNVRSLLYASFKNKGFKKNSKTSKLLGCDFETAIKSIGWFKGCEIHHIIPLETAKTKKDIIRLNHYTNLIALTPKEHKTLHMGIFELIPRKEKVSKLEISGIIEPEGNT